MTIETTVNKTIQSGNGSNKDFDFAFEIPDEDSLSLTKRGSDGTETAITTNFTVTGIGDEAGGTVNYPTSGSALGVSEKIIIKRVVALKQPENLRNQGDYSLEDIEDALDRAAMLCQQLQEQIDRSLKLPLTSSSTYVTVDDFVANKLLYVSSDGTKVKMSDADFGSIQTYLTALAAIAADISAVAAIDTEVTTVAGIDTEVTTVAGIDAEIIIVAGIAADVAAVAAIDSDVTQVSSIHAAVSTVSSINAAVSTVAGISAAVSTVSGIAAAVSGVNTIAAAVSGVYAINDDVVAVAAIAANVTSVAGNATNINTVAGIAAAVTSVAAIAANVSTVAGISANVTTVAGMESNIASVVANMASILNAASFGFPTLASGDENKILQINTSFNGYNAVKPIPRRNVLMNGDFLIWQRGTSFSSIADNTVFADRWRYRKSGTMVHNVSRSTDVPTVAQAGRKIPYSIKIDCTTVDSSIAAGDFCFITQRVEGYRFAQLIAQKASVGHFWVKAPKTGTFCIAHNNSGNDRGYVSEYTILAANTWEKKTVNVAASPSAGTWVYDNGIGIDFNVILAAGSTYHTTPGAWQTGVFLGTSNQVNACDNTANDFYITEIMWEEGSQPTSFEALPFGEVLRDCQRYYEKSYNYGTAIGAVTDDGKTTLPASSGGAVIFTTPFKVSKRTNPTCVFYSNGSGASGQIRNESGAADLAASPAFANDYGLGISKGGLTSGHIIGWHFTADAEL